MKSEKRLYAVKFEMATNADWSFFRLPELEKRGILHGFCTGSAPSNLVQEKTKQDFLKAFSLKNLVIMDQEHGDHIHIIKNGQTPHAGDGLIILEKNVAGIIKTADCLPIILCDTFHPMAAIIHAGWRGTVKKIVRKAVFSMVQLGSRTENMAALLGPLIGPCCYEVKEDVFAFFNREGFPGDIFRKENGSIYLDLKQANTWLLRESGITTIYDTDLCTYCNDTMFYSFRRGDASHRQINFVSLRG